MKHAQRSQILQSLLYEGYILYPYRPSSQKNQRERFTFGRVYPQAWHDAQRGAESCVMQTQCLVRGAAAEIEAEIHFLQPVQRPRDSWLEAAERRVNLCGWRVGSQALHTPFHFPGCEGRAELYSEVVDDAVSRITVRIWNGSPLDAEDLKDSQRVLLHTCCSTHTVISVKDGQFLSALDPPAEYQEAVAACSNIGTWPVLLGNNAAGAPDTVLSSPIILYDYPVIADESPGDWCDATEVDEMLALRVQTMTDAEKLEMREVDDHARRILERSEGLGNDAFGKLHGALRDFKGFDDIFGSNERLDGVRIGNTFLKAGDGVRIRPRARADIMDLALAGKTASIEAVEQDAEGKVHLALVIDDDPGKDLGMMRQPGHRFFYGIDEVEPIVEERS